jgi:UDP-N-acetylmuramyl pentapeptide phosphotransferase/UDP-N-acetylglucosamine-1-phosphate transferase
MRDLAGVLLSAALAAVIAPAALRAFAAAGWTRPNHRGRELPFPAGAVAVCAGLLALGALSGLDRVAATFTTERGTRSVAVLALGIAFLGLLDDALDDGPRGWRGHLRAVLRGRFSTGAMKAVGTVALTLAAIPGDGIDLVLAVAVVALAANAFNQLDLRPGRAVKAWVILAAGLLIVTRDTLPLQAIGPWAGALLVLGLHDLRERCMLGDTGANLLGAMAGTWIVLVSSTTGLAVAAAALLALNLFGEFRSITTAIDRVPPLRRLDSLGRKIDA